MLTSFLASKAVNFRRFLQPLALHVLRKVLHQHVPRLLVLRGSVFDVVVSRQLHQVVSACGPRQLAEPIQKSGFAQTRSARITGPKRGTETKEKTPNGR